MSSIRVRITVFPDIASVYVIVLNNVTSTGLLIKFISISKILDELKWHI
jgi:hypothetical protein